MKNSIRSILTAVLAAAVLLSLPGCAFSENYTDPWGYTDEDGDGIVFVQVPGETFTAYMLIVPDPTRVVLGCSPDTIGGKGYELSRYIEKYDALAGVNGGGFDDPQGMGNGSMPDAVIVHEGEAYCGWLGIGNCFVGIDDAGFLQVGFSRLEELKERNIKEGAGYGPLLVVNGEAADNSEYTFNSALNPRTAIGQRADGAILLLVTDGRQPNSLGASYEDEAELMLRFGAVNACNLDGGNSSLMWLGGEYINNKAGAIGVRPIPTSYLVLREGTDPSWQAPELSGDDLTGLTCEEAMQAAFHPEDHEANCTPEEKAELEAFAELFIREYVKYTADVNGMHNINCADLVNLTVKDGALSQRLKKALGSFGYSFVRYSEVITCDLEACSREEDGSYTVAACYQTETSARSSEPVVEQKHIVLTVTRTDAGLRAESMHFY